MINLNNRLSTCSKFVIRGGIAADIGTDHGYLATYLVLNNISKKVFACDIKEKPLNSARQTVNKYNVIDKVEIILSDGLEKVPDENITDVIIAGMGGELISQIINNAKWLQRGTNLVLQPMTKVEFLRKWLYENGFEILKEEAITDEGFTYTVIQSVYNGLNYTIDESFSYIGLVDKETIDGKKYIAIIQRRIETIATGLTKSQSKNIEAKKYFELSEKIKSLLEE